MSLNKRTAYELVGLSILTLLLYWPSFQFDFVNFDDQLYILNNAFIQHPSLSGLLDGSGTGNFHPITMLSLWLDYWLGSGSPVQFHITNVIWHLLNTLLVFFLVGKLLPNRAGVSFFVALLFAIHPMHIESVAWISSRKDVLYTFFYLSALIAYIQYLNTEAKKYLFITFFAAIISFLSKPAAITLPVALTLIYYLKFGKIDVKKLLPIAPLFLGSLIIGLLTLQLQQDAAINTLETYSIFERLGFACYGLYFYIIKGILPTGLSPMHPYPPSQELLELSFLAPVFLGLLFLAFGLFYARKNKVFLFAFLFFLLNLVLMLQLVSVGRAIVSERYSYLCYIGLLLALVILLDAVPTVKKVKSVFYVLSLVIGIPFFLLASQQLSIWKNSEALWNKAIEVYPQDWFGFIGRGNHYKDSSQYAKALADFSTAIQLAPERFDNYFNLGDLQHQLGNTQEAIQIYSRAIELRPDYEQAYINRGQFYIAVSDGARALADFNQAISLNPNSHLAYNNRGNLYLLIGNQEVAITDFSTAIELNPGYAQAWFNRGTARLNADLENAKQDLEQAIIIDPNYFDAYNNLGSVYVQLNEYASAARTYTKALQINPEEASTWLNLSIVQQNMGNYSGALGSALKAREQGAQVSDTYINQLKAAII